VRRGSRRRERMEHGEGNDESEEKKMKNRNLIKKRCGVKYNVRKREGTAEN
jgi:hypothetical protein